MFRTTVLCVMFLLGAVWASSVYAGTTEQATTYPAPSGEYTDIKADNSLTVPEKSVGTSTNGLAVGEIWFEKCPTGTAWNGSACA